NTSSAGGSEIVWADFNAGEDQYFGTPAWTPDNQLWVQWMNRGQDMLKVYEVNKTDGSKKAVYTENQPTWIVLDDSERFHFLPSGTGVLIKSDKEGWQNLYLHDKAGKQIAKVTDGNFWDISVMLVDEKNKQVFFKARK